MLGVRAIIEEELKQIEMYGSSIPSMGGTQQRINYLRDLLKTISSETQQREVQIAPRLFKLYDATKGITGFVGSGHSLDDIGLYYLYNMRSGKSASLNMFECRDDKSGKTISCMQKVIDTAKEVNDDRYTNSSVQSRVCSMYTQ